MIDAATLTGACVVALGHAATGVFGNDEALVREVLDAGTRPAMRGRHLPLFEDYREQMKSDVADIRNSGGRAAGASTAAIFLREFVRDFPWVHMDIAGTAYSDKDLGHLPKGPPACPSERSWNLREGGRAERRERWSGREWLLIAAMALAGTRARAGPATRARHHASPRDTRASRATPRARRATPVAREPEPRGIPLVLPLPSDTTRDTTKVPKDTIKAPLAHAERPLLLGVGSQYHWDRDSIFSSGAANLLDLLGRIPGVTRFRSGWLGSPEFASYPG